MKGKTSFPITVKRGSVRVMIYRTPNNRGFESFTVVYYQDATRKRVVLSPLSKALKRAKAVAKGLAKGQIDAADLSAQDRAAYINAKRLLKPTRYTLEAACREFAEAMKILGGVSILTVAREYVKRHGTDPKPMTVQEVVDEFMEAKEEGRATRLRGNGRSVSEKYLYQLRLKLNTFASELKNRLIKTVTSEDVNDFVHGMKQASGRTKNNYLQTLNVLFEYARKQRYVPRDCDVMDEVETAAEADFEIEIYSPQELKLLLAHCPESLVPVLVLGGYAGLRTAEIERLDWSEVNLDGKHIEVKAKKAKTRARRLVPITPNLAAWLEKCKQLEGPVWPQSLPYLFQLQREAAKAAGVTWKHNALRHSFISYRVADVKNVAEVALEAGNSPEMIFQHYRELVTAETAKDWFGVTPDLVAAEKAGLLEEGKKRKVAKEAEKARKKKGRKKAEAAGGQQPGNVVALPGVKVAA